MRIVYILCFCMLYMGCNKEDIYPDDSCLGEASINESDMCDEEDITDEFCTMRYNGNFSLQQSSKSYLPFYCREIGDMITFENGSGQELEFEVLEKDYFQSHRYDYFTHCTDDTTKYILECYDVEMANVVISSSLITLKLELTPMHYLDSDKHLVFGDDLWIYRKSPNNHFLTTFVAVIFKGEREVNNAPCRELLPEINLNGNTFYDVISYVEGMNCGPYRFWVNAHEGLVAFSLSDDEIWSYSK